MSREKPGFRNGLAGLPLSPDDGTRKPAFGFIGVPSMMESPMLRHCKWAIAPAALACAGLLGFSAPVAAQGCPPDNPFCTPIPTCPPDNPLCQPSNTPTLEQRLEQARARIAEERQRFADRLARLFGSD